jgi:hypothetical protein
VRTTREKSYENDERGGCVVRASGAWKQEIPRKLKFLREGRIPTWRLGLLEEVWVPTRVGVPTWRCGFFRGMRVFPMRNEDSHEGWLSYL